MKKQLIRLVLILAFVMAGTIGVRGADMPFLTDFFDLEERAFYDSEKTDEEYNGWVYGSSEDLNGEALTSLLHSLTEDYDYECVNVGREKRSNAKIYITSIEYAYRGEVTAAPITPSVELIMDEVEWLKEENTDHELLLYIVTNLTEPDDPAYTISVYLSKNLSYGPRGEAAVSSLPASEPGITVQEIIDFIEESLPSKAKKGEEYEFFHMPLTFVKTYNEALKELIDASEGEEENESLNQFYAENILSLTRMIEGTVYYENETRNIGLIFIPQETDENDTTYYDIYYTIDEGEEEKEKFAETVLGYTLYKLTDAFNLQEMWDWIVEDHGEYGEFPVSGVNFFCFSNDDSNGEKEEVYTILRLEEEKLNSSQEIWNQLANVQGLSESFANMMGIQVGDEILNKGLTDPIALLISGESLSLTFNVAPTGYSYVQEDYEKESLSRERLQNVLQVLEDIGVNLQEIVINNCEVESLAPLSLATGLRKIDLCHTGISSLADLDAGEHKQLISLFLDDNEIREFSTLEGFDTLQNLSLAGNKITDLSGIPAFGSLTHLNLDRNEIVDVSPLAKLEGLAAVSIRHNKIRDISPMSSLPNLSLLYLDDNEIVDFSSVEGVSDLTGRYKQREIREEIKEENVTKVLEVTLESAKATKDYNILQGNVYNAGEMSYWDIEVYVRFLDAQSQEISTTSVTLDQEKGLLPGESVPFEVRTERNRAIASATAEVLNARAGGTDFGSLNMNPEFLEAVKDALGLKQNEELSEERCQSITSLDVSGKGLTDLTGVVVFNNLQILDCSDNALVTLDVSGNTSLQKIKADNNQLTKLVLGKLPELTILSVKKNELKNVDLTEVPALEELYAASNKLKKLDVSKNSKLKTLVLKSNRLTFLDVRGLKGLSHLDLQKNRFPTRDAVKMDQSVETLFYAPQKAVIDGNLSIDKLLQKGMDCEKDEDYLMAQKYYLMAAQKGSTMAYEYLNAHIYDRQKGKETYYENDIKKYIEELDDSDPYVQAVLGDIYNKGYIVNEDDERGREYFRQSKEQGNNYGLTCYGEMVYAGKGGEENKEEGFRILKEAAEKGDPFAQADMSLICADAESVHYDADEAMRWAQFSVDQDSAAGYYAMGQIHLFITENYEEAMKNFITAANKQWASAEFLLGYMYEFGLAVSYDEKKAMEYYLRAAEGRDGDAMCFIGQHYLYGTDAVDQDYEEAVRWLKMSAELGKGYSYYLLGNCYEEGNGVTRDLDEALRYYKLAKDADIAEAEEAIDRITSSQGGEDISARIPDEQFKLVIREQLGLGENDPITKADCESITKINCFDKGIKSIEGIEYLTNLQVLNCGKNDIVTADLTKNDRLREVSLYSNSLTSISFGKNERLSKIVIFSNNLSEIDVKDITGLKELNVAMNGLSVLDVTNNKNLQKLECYSNNLTSVDVSQNPELTYLYVSGNKLGDIDVSKNPKLEHLLAWTCSLDKVDLRNNPLLIELKVQYNDLKPEDILLANTPDVFQY